MSPGSEEFNEYRLMILDKLNTLDERTAAMSREIADNTVELASLKARASVWGAVAGAIVAIASAILGGGWHK